MLRKHSYLLFVALAVLGALRLWYELSLNLPYRRSIIINGCWRILFGIAAAFYIWRKKKTPRKPEDAAHMSPQYWMIAWTDLCALGAVSFLVFHEKLLTISAAILVFASFNAFLAAIFWLSRKFLTSNEG